MWQPKCLRFWFEYIDRKLTKYLWLYQRPIVYPTQDNIFRDLTIKVSWKALSCSLINICRSWRIFLIANNQKYNGVFFKDTLKKQTNKQTKTYVVEELVNVGFDFGYRSPFSDIHFCKGWYWLQSGFWKTLCLHEKLYLLVWFYGISTFVGYLRPNPFLCK